MIFAHRPRKVSLTERHPTPLPHLRLPSPLPARSGPPARVSGTNVFCPAFVLYLNGIVTETPELNEKTLPQVRMPNRDGFIPETRPFQKRKAQ